MNATGRMRRAIEDELRYLVRQDEEGESARKKELRCSKEFWCGPVHPKAEDPFRAVAWLLNAISSWHLAVITMSRLRDLRDRGPGAEPVHREGQPAQVGLRCPRAAEAP